MNSTVLFLALAMLLGLLPAWLAERKGHSFAAWWVFGALLFIVALPLAVFLERKTAAVPTRVATKKCIHCGALLRVTARDCPACHQPIPAAGEMNQSDWEKTVDSADEVARWSQVENNDRRTT